MSVLSQQAPIGAGVQDNHSTLFRVWAPRPREISLVITTRDGGERELALSTDEPGFYQVQAQGVGAGDRYHYRLDGELVADPASRFQPEGPFGPSEVVDPSRYQWTDSAWRGVHLAGQVLYEMHVGTFTPEGTWQAAADRLPALVDIGISVIEVMPVAEFAGRFGWGYDGVFPFAPFHRYGAPDDFRAFVDRAHALGLGVILDVVYNHLGPEGCVFSRYAPQYYSTVHKGEWGDPLNFDGEDSGPVREFFTLNAATWIAEYHLDGLRLDATQGIHDRSPEHVLTTLSRATRSAAGGRTLILVAENERQETRLVRPPEQGGMGLDALWNDDFHHSAVVALTGRREAYYSDHFGRPQEFIASAKYGFLFQGQRYAWQKQGRGTSARGVPPAAFVDFLENHDQVANSGDGSRLHTRTSPGRLRAMTALLLLLPATPMLFQGQEFGSTAPFLYFADLSPELAAAVQKGRAEFVSQFSTLATNEMQQRLPAPHDPATFERCRLDWGERDRHSQIVQLHRDLIALRRRILSIREQAANGIDGTVLADEAFVLRLFGTDPVNDCLVAVNLGIDFHATSIADPLVAPPEGCNWCVTWSSESPEYGGFGTPPVVDDTGWHLAGHSAVVLETTPL